MLRGGALVPTLDGLPYFHKPPLLYWIGIVAMSLLGASEFAVRLAPALGAWLLGAALFLHLRRWHGEAVARTGLGVLATSPFFFLGGQFVNHDMLVAGCITAAVLAFVRALDDPRVVALRWLVAGWAFCGLGVLSKGLIGIVLPALVLAPWLLAQARWRDLLRLLHPVGLAAGAVVALPWMWAMQQRYPGFFDYFIVEQHFRRFSGVTFNNPQPPWFFLWAVPVVTLPWSLWLWPAARQAWLSGWRGRDMRTALYVWWVVVVIAFFSLPRSKLLGYVLPALAPWSALLALALVARGRAWRRTMPAAALICVVLVGAVAWQAPKSQRELGRALAAQWRPGDRVVFVDQYFFDLPFYAGLDEPAVVLADWADPDLPRHDNWRKELFDAARFATPEARRVLWPRGREAALLCHAGTVWFVAGGELPAALAALPGLVPAARTHNGRLWRAAGSVCPAP